MFFESECEYFTFSLRRARDQLGGLHWSIHIYQRRYLDRYFFFLLNRDTQILNEKTNWFWHLWPYCNLELGHADLRSSMHKRHPKTKIFAPQIGKTDASALGDFCSNYVKDVFAALPLYCKGKQWDCELFLIVTFPYCFFFSGIHVQRFQCWHLTFTHSIWTTQRCLFHGLRILN